jgi:Ca2+-binding EF-hand superfamily protein
MNGKISVNELLSIMQVNGVLTNKQQVQILFSAISGEKAASITQISEFCDKQLNKTSMKFNEKSESVIQIRIKLINDQFKQSLNGKQILELLEELQLTVASVLNESELEKFLTYIGTILKKDDIKFLFEQIKSCLSEKNQGVIFQDLINYAIKYSIELSEFQSNV